MITTTAQIIARISDPKQAQKLRGKGIVEKKLDDTTYLIRFSSGKIKVTVTSGALTPGTVVQANIREGKIILQPLPASGSHGDRIVLTGQKQEAAVNKAVHELLSVLGDISLSKGSGQPEPDYNAIVQKLAAALQDNQQLINSDKALQAVVAKIIEYSSQPVKSFDQKALPEIKSLVQSFQQKLIELCFQQQNTVKLPEPVEEGFIYFANKEEATDWLVKTQPQIDKNVPDSIVLSNSEPVIIRTVLAGDGTTAAMVMNEKEATLILSAYIHSEGKHPLWEALPPDLLYSILESKGSITIETIEAIDKILQFYTNNVQTKPIEPEDITRPIMQQWIALMVENDHALKTISSFTPSHTAENIAHMIEHDMAGSHPKAAVITEIIKEVLTNTVNNPGILKTEVISQAFEKMGYNLEQELTKVASSDYAGGKEVSDNVKAALLSLLLQTIPQGEHTIPSPVQAEVKGVQKPEYIIPQLHAIDTLSQKLMEIVNIDLEKIMTELGKQEVPQPEKGVCEALHELKNAVTELIQQVSGDNQKLLALLNVEPQSKTAAELKATSPLASLSQPAASSPDSIDQLLSYLIKSAVSLEKNLEPVKAAINSTPSIDPQIAQQVIENNEKLLTIIKDLIAQIQEYNKSVTQATQVQLTDVDQEVKTTTVTPPLSVEELQEILENLRNLISILEGAPEKEAVETLTKPSLPISIEELQNQIKATLQAILSALEQNSQEFIKQLHELVSDVKPQVQVEITEFTSQLTELLKHLADTVRSEISEYLSAQQPVKEEPARIDRTEIEKLLNTLLQFVEKQKQEILHYTDMLKDLVSTDARQVVNTLIDKTADIIARISEQLETLLKSIKSLEATPLNITEGQNAVIKQIITNNISSLFRPLDNILNALKANLIPTQAGSTITSQIQAVTDEVYKAAVDARSTLSSEITALSQGIIKNVEGSKGYNTGDINTTMKNLFDIVNSLNNKLSSLQTSEKPSVENAFRNILQHFNTASNQWLKESNAALSGIEQNLSNSVQELKESLAQSIIQQTAAQKDIGSQLDPYLYKTIQNSAYETVDTVKQLTAQISSNFSSPRLSAMENLQQQLHDTFKAIESSVKEMILNLQKSISHAEQRITNSIHELQKGETSQTVISKNIQSTTSQLSSDMSRILDSTLKEMMALLEKTAKDVEKNPENLLRQVNNSMEQVKQEIEQLIRTINRQITNLASRAEKAIDTLLPDGIRQQVETALTRLETLQLLAKPVPTSEGQQQIISLPMKIGGEWTDVNILLIKKRDKKKAKISSDKFAVRMYVSPSRCGPVIVNMDYHVKHKLTVRIEFEKNDARLWFNKNKEELINALKEYGMASVALSLESAPAKEPAQKGKRATVPVKKGQKRSKIDISI